MAPDTRFPDTSTVEACLKAMLRDLGCGSGVLVGIERRPNPLMSSAPSEVVTCRFAGGERLQLLLKYDDPTADYGHWVSVGHEIRVYRDILRTLPIRVPKYYGTFTVGPSRQRCLVLEWVNGKGRWEFDDEAGTAMVLAAHWLGQFHATTEARIGEGQIRFLDTYDVEYYAGCARRVVEYAGPLHDRYPWLPGLCERFGEASSLLAKGPLTVIHGEYYIHNILWTDAGMCAVDWQSAAIARGEVDLASLTEQWGDDLEARCEQEYVNSRWRGESPDGFREVLALARVYWPIRWLSRGPGAILGRHRKHLDYLAILGERAGLL
jgi:hypothetical protein